MTTQEKCELIGNLLEFLGDDEALKRLTGTAPAGTTSETCCGARSRAEWQGDHKSPHGRRVAETKDGGGIRHDEIIDAAALTFRVAREMFYDVEHPHRQKLMDAAALMAEIAAKAIRPES